MQSNLFTNLLVNRTAEVQPVTEVVRSVPIELDFSKLNHVAGGMGPNGTWAAMGPNGTW